MSAAPSSAGYVHEAEDPRLLEANLRVGVRLLLSAVLFVFVAFVFAFFYLKAVNTNGNWRPTAVKPSQGYGIAILIGVLATLASFELARRELARASWSRWRAGAGLALALALVVVLLDVLQLTQAGFGATGGGYASVFYGWCALSLVLWLGAIYWVETMLAGSLRARHASDQVGGGPLELLGPSAQACTVFLAGVAAIQLVTWLLLYLIK